MSDEARERAAVEHDRPGAAIVKARDTVEERRLAGAVGPDQAANGLGRCFDGAFAPRSNSRLRLSRFRLANQRIGFLRFAACADLQGVWHGGKISGYGER